MINLALSCTPLPAYVQTATSTIQQFLSKNKQANKILTESDNVALYTRINSQVWSNVSRILLFKQPPDDFDCTTSSGTPQKMKKNKKKKTTPKNNKKKLKRRLRSTSSSDDTQDTCWMKYVQQTNEWRTFVESVRQDRKQNKNIIWSDETLYGTLQFDEKLRLLNKVLTTTQNEQEYQIEVVVTYRKYYDFIISLYNQNMKIFPKKLIDGSDHLISSFVDWYHGHGHYWSLQNTLLESFNNNNNDENESGMSLIKTILPNDTRIRVFNMYNDDDTEQDQGLVTRFVCFLGDIANNLCNDMLSQPSMESSSSSKNSHTDTLDSQYILQRSLIAALESRSTSRTTTTNSGGASSSSSSLDLSKKRNKKKKKLNKQRSMLSSTTSSTSKSKSNNKVWTRTDISIATMELSSQVQQFKEDFVFNSNKTIPLSCLSNDDLQSILDISIELEKTLVPTYYGDGHQLQDDFNRAVESNKFCSVDYESLMVNNNKSSWRIFMSNLVNEYIESKEKEHDEAASKKA